MDSFVQELFTSRGNYGDGTTRVGQKGRIWYDSASNAFRVGDGVTPGGILISGGTGGYFDGGGAIGSFDFNIAADDSTQRTVNAGETVQFLGSRGIGTASNASGVITITGPDLSGYALSSALSSYALSSSVPTNNNQLTNGAAFITASALTGLATETYVTNRGYITSSALTGLATETYVTTRGYITSSALTSYATQSYVTSQGYITSAALSTYALTSSVPTDISQLTDSQGLLGQGGGGGGTTYIQNPFAFSVAGDDSTLREISNGESVKFTGAGGIAVTTDAEGNITITGTPVSLTGYATETYVTSRGYITSSALIGLATTGYVDNSTATALNEIDARIAGLSYNDLADKPNLAGTYSWRIAGDDSSLREISAGESVKFVGVSGITTASDAEGNITITGPSLAGLATETFVTTQGYITGSSLTGLATESYVTSRGYITGLSWENLTNKPNLAGTYSWSVAADDSAQIEISAGNLVKIAGGVGISTASDPDGTITITGFSGSYNDLTDVPTASGSAINANGTFSMPLLSAEPNGLQAGQIALANGTTWDPLSKGNSLPYMTIYTGTHWIEIGGLTATNVYSQILELT